MKESYMSCMYDVLPCQYDRNHIPVVLWADRSHARVSYKLYERLCGSRIRLNPLFSCTLRRLKFSTSCRLVVWRMCISLQFKKNVIQNPVMWEQSTGKHCCSKWKRWSTINPTLPPRPPNWALLMNLSSHRVFPPRTSFNWCCSTSSFGYIKAAFGVVTSFTSTFNHASGMGRKWKVSIPPNLLTNPTATICFEFLGFIRHTCCPMHGVLHTHRRAVTYPIHLKDQGEQHFTLRLLHNFSATMMQLLRHWDITNRWLGGDQLHCDLTITEIQLNDDYGGTIITGQYNFEAMELHFTKDEFFEVRYLWLRFRIRTHSLQHPRHPCHRRCPLVLSLRCCLLDTKITWVNYLTTIELREGTIARLNRMVHKSPHHPLYV
jgi:hypothetical protein